MGRVGGCNTSEVIVHKKHGDVALRYVVGWLELGLGDLGGLFQSEWFNERNGLFCKWMSGQRVNDGGAGMLCYGKELQLRFWLLPGWDALAQEQVAMGRAAQGSAPSFSWNHKLDCFGMDLKNVLSSAEYSVFL